MVLFKPKLYIVHAHGDGKGEVKIILIETIILSTYKFYKVQCNGVSQFT